LGLPQPKVAKNIGAIGDFEDKELYNVKGVPTSNLSLQKRHQKQHSTRLGEPKWHPCRWGQQELTPTLGPLVTIGPHKRQGGKTVTTMWAKIGKNFQKKNVRCCGKKKKVVAAGVSGGG